MLFSGKVETYELDITDRPENVAMFIVRHMLTMIKPLFFCMKTIATCPQIQASQGQPKEVRQQRNARQYVQIIIKTISHQTHGVRIIHSTIQT